MGELVKSVELKRGLIPTDLSLAPLWLSALIGDAVTSFSVCVAGDYWSETLSLLSHLRGEGGRGLGREKERRRKPEGGWEDERGGLRGERERERERRHSPQGVLSCLCCLEFFYARVAFVEIWVVLSCLQFWSLSSLMSLNSRGRSNLSQDSAFRWVALTDVRDVLMSDDTFGRVSRRFWWMLDGLDFNQELVLESLWRSTADLKHHLCQLYFVLHERVHLV